MKTLRARCFPTLDRLVGCMLLLLAAASVTRAENGGASAVLDQLEWRNIGPAIMGGRIGDFAVVESNPKVFFVATNSAGLWKTSNNGITFEALFQDQAVSSIGDVTVAPSDPSIVWVGTGEVTNRQSSSWGNGVHKSTDGGATWSHRGLEDTHHIGRIRIHPINPDIVYVAALGHLWGANEERGIYKSTDGGTTWTRSLFVDADTGFVDLAMDPESPDTLYAAAYQRRRQVFGFSGGGTGSGLYKTTDGGATWSRLVGGLPEGIIGRIGIDVYRKDPRVVYAIVEHKEGGGVFRSENKGATWTRMSDTNPRPMYYSHIHIDPNNDQRIWVLGAPMYLSEDGGKSFATDRVTEIHGDYHALWINPADSDHMLLGSDGGIHLSYDRGASWDYINTLALGQFYEVGYDMKTPYNVYGGLQDNGSWAGPVRTLYQQGIGNEDWFRVGGGDGFYTRIDPHDPSILYVESQNGSLSRLHLDTSERKSIQPQPGPDEPNYRFDWNSPIEPSRHDPGKIYYGGNRLFISDQRGDHWSRTDDLTRQIDRDELPIMGQEIGDDTLSKHDGVSSFGQIVTISESPLERGVLYAGTDDGNLQVSRDDGKSWTNVAGRLDGVPDGTYVTRVVASMHAPGRVYATFDGHRNDDFGSYVQVSENYGERWRSLAGTLPAGHTLNVVREHPKRESLLFSGGERGLYVSLDRGQQWHRVGGGFPTVPVDDIAIHPRENDLIVGTHGRSIWVLDDMGPLVELSDAVLAKELHVFPTRDAVAYRMYNHKGDTGHKTFLAPNPPDGALIHYLLKSQPEKEGAVKITVTGGDGEVIRELDGSQQAGYNRVAWDLRYRSPVPQRPGQEGGGGGGGGFGRGARGPRVMPGTYTVTVRVESGDTQAEASSTVQVSDDPRIQIIDADRKRMITEQLRVGEILASMARAQSRAEGLIEQLVEYQKSFGGGSKNPAASPDADSATSEAAGSGRRGPRGQGTGPGSSQRAEPAGVTVPDEVKAKLEETLEKVRELERALSRTGGRDGFGDEGPRPLFQRIARLGGSFDSFTEAPNEEQVKQIDAFDTEVKGLVARLEAVTSDDIAALNKALRDASVPHIRLEPQGPPGGDGRPRRQQSRALGGNNEIPLGDR